MLPTIVISWIRRSQLFLCVVVFLIVHRFELWTHLTLHNRQKKFIHFAWNTISIGRHLFLLGEKSRDNLVNFQQFSFLFFHFPTKLTLTDESRFTTFARFKICEHYFDRRKNASSHQTSNQRETKSCSSQFYLTVFRCSLTTFSQKGKNWNSFNFWEIIFVCV